MELAGMKVVVCGAGGFIGGHLVRDLVDRGIDVIRAVDIKPPETWYQPTPGVDTRVLDLQLREACRSALRGADAVFHLAADMGGMGFIENNRAACHLNVLIDTHMGLAARDERVQRVFYASSACVYNQSKQRSPKVTALAEADAHPADPEPGYGVEKLYAEEVYQDFERDFGTQYRIARYHNVYGPHGTWSGGREKAPAAICRKVLEAKYSGAREIEIWGDGTQTRSFMFIDDCLKGTHLLFDSNFNQPLNIGSSELVSISQLVDLVEEIAGTRLHRRYDLTAPRGVNGRNSDNTLIVQQLGWQPSTKLREGLVKTYAWIETEMLAAGLLNLRSISRAPKPTLLRPTFPSGPHLLSKSDMVSSASKAPLPRP